MSQSFVKPIAPTQSAEPTSHSKWPNTRSPPNLNRPKEGAGNKKFRIYSISSSPYKFTTIYRSYVKDTTIIIWRSIPTSPDILVWLWPDKNITTGTIGSSRGLVASRSRSCGRRRRRRRSWCWGWSAPSASGRTRSVEPASTKRFSINVSGADQENEALWAGRREEAEGADDPVLAPVLKPL